MNRLYLFAASTALIFVLACGGAEEPAEPVVETISEGERLIEEGAYEEAQAYYEGEITAAPAEADNHFLAGQAAAMAANYDAAVAHINKAMELKPETAGHYDWLGRIYGAQARIGNLLETMQLAPLVKENFEKAAELDPDNTETQFFLGTFYVVAPARFGGDKEKGRAIADALLKSDPLAGHRLMAQIHALNKEADAAETEYKEAIALSPDDTQSHTDLGNLYVATGKLDLADDAFAKALELDPDNQAALLGRGEMGGKSKDYRDQGIESLEKLSTLKRNIQSPNMGNAYFLLGTLYREKRMWDEAIQAYENAGTEGHLAADKAIANVQAAMPVAESPAAADGATTASQETEGMEAAPAEEAEADAELAEEQPLEGAPEEGEAAEAAE